MISAYGFKKLKKVLLSSFVSIMVIAGMATPLTVKAEPQKKDYSKKYKMISLDAGRKYFSANQINRIIDHASSKGFTHLHLLLGNDAFRFTLNDMDVHVNDKVYKAADINKAITKGNFEYMTRQKAQNIQDAAKTLSESDMNKILAHAKAKNMKIIPGINMPGHMDSIVTVMEEMKDLGNVRFTGDKGTSLTTMNYDNEKAAQFMKSFLQKYLDYFKSKGIKEFNFGADEIGNDAVSGYKGGYDYLSKRPAQYATLVKFINKLADQVDAAGMTPYCFNDGLYYNDNTAHKFSSKIRVFYWSCGHTWWGAPDSGSAKTIIKQGHKIVNVNEKWYYVLGRERADCPSRGGAYTAFPYEGMDPSKASTVKMKDVTFDYVREHPNDNKNLETLGSMIALWCDIPSMPYEEDKFFKYMDIFADSNPDVFKKENPVAPEMKRTMSVKGTMKVASIDAGRKFFSAQDIKNAIARLKEKDYTHLQLILGNNGLRFALDNMDIKANNKTYKGEDIKKYIKAGNKEYMTSKYAEDTENADRFLTETEMNDILDFAKKKGIQIIPLINTPGHMDTILSVMEKAGLTQVRYDCKDPKYDQSDEPSATTISMENKEALEFTKTLVKKYMDYFSKKGCQFFNIGADEYGNHDSNCQGFADLQKLGLYKTFIAYINELAKYATDRKVRPMVFNDGIYYGEKDNDGQFDPNILVAYWTSGFPYNGHRYQPAQTTYLAKKDHEILNTNDNWYYVIGTESPWNQSWYGFNMAMRGVSKHKFAENVGNPVKTVGSMICLWCDNPGKAYKEKNFFQWVDAFANNNPDVFKKRADYSKVDEALEKAKKYEKEKNNYTAESYDKLDKAVKAVIRDKYEEEQPTVDLYAVAIESAIAQLKLKPADYTAINEIYFKAKKAVAYRKNYVDKTIDELEKVLNEISFDLTIKEQEKVNNLAKRLKDAYEALELKDADYSEVEKAKKEVPDLKNYTEETAKAVTKALAAVQEGLKIDEQDKVDQYAKNIRDAISKLEEKKADYSNVDKALKNVPKDLSSYTEESVERLNRAIEAAKKRDLKISQQKKAEAIAEEINNAIAGLVKKNITYKMTPGDVIKGQKAVFRSSADIKKFKQLLIDNKIVDSKNYKVTEGSTIITLSKEYTKTLSVGEHTIQIVSVDGQATAKFTVKDMVKVEETKPATKKPEKKAKENMKKKPSKADTSDSTHIIGYIIVIFISLAGAITLKKKFN
ncbi:hypothetical protein B7939_00785 [Eggerthia catenaformis]|nr:hypothetical protein B7939_00785 [Eggerthia catenaformis]